MGHEGREDDRPEMSHPGGKTRDRCGLSHAYANLRPKPLTYLRPGKFRLLSIQLVKRALELPDALFHLVGTPEHTCAADHYATVEGHPGLIACFPHRYFMHLAAARAGHQDFFEFVFGHEITITSWGRMIKKVPALAGRHGGKVISSTIARDDLICVRLISLCY
jgi:hypothetical protein